NLLVSDGEALVVDFGIAQAVEMAGGSGITLTGVVMGTPGYMSPEQSTGARVDGKSDLYSLGCVFYEMLTGQPPFAGSSASSVALDRSGWNPGLESGMDPPSSWGAGVHDEELDSGGGVRRARFEYGISRPSPRQHRAGSVPGRIHRAT